MDLVEHLLTTEDMMAVLRVSRRTLDDYLARKKLPKTDGQRVTATVWFS